MATAPSPNDLTRQQLDELDALLQRMLSLPINPPDAYTPPGAVANVPAAYPAFAPPLPPPYSTPSPVAVAAPPISRRVDTATPAPVLHLYAAPAAAPPPTPSVAPPRVVAPPPPAPPSVAAPARTPAPRPAATFTPPSAPAVAPPAPPQAPVKAAPPRAETSAAPPSPRVALLVPMSSPAERSEPAPTVPEPPSLIVMPLVLFNQGVNTSLGLLGLPGRILRSGFVKTLFGLSGLALLIYTGLKAAQSQGWISLPVSLPWPR